MKHQFDSKATICIVSALLLWSTGPTFIKLLTGYVDFWTQNLLRYTAACVVTMPFLFIAVKKEQLNKRLLTRAIFPAAANIIMQCFWVKAFYFINPAFMNMLSKSSVIWIAGFSIIFFAQERTLIKSNRFWLGIVMSLVGVAGVLLYQQGFSTTSTMTGIIMALVAAFLWGVYTISVRITFKNVDSRTGFAVICLYTTMGLLALAFLFGKPTQCLTMSPKGWGYTIISGILCIAITHVLYYESIKRIGATIPSLILLLTPFTVLAISHFVFGESLNTFQLFFGLILLIGSGFAIWAQQHLK